MLSANLRQMLVEESDAVQQTCVNKPVLSSRRCQAVSAVSCKAFHTVLGLPVIFSWCISHLSVVLFIQIYKWNITVKE